MPTRPLIALLGPTASGKSALGLDLASRFNLEIVNCDSRQIYSEMDIGTSKPTLQERASIPHHLYDIVTPDKRFSAGDYLREAALCCEKIWSRGGVPILIGGSGFYYDALIKGLPRECANEEVQNTLQKRLESDGLSVLAEELGRLDPAAAAAVDLHNPRRVLRALELLITTGKPLAEIRHRRGALKAETLAFFVTRNREHLHERIIARTDAMIAAGLADEAKALLAKYGSKAPGLQTIGYIEWADDKALESQIREGIIIHTRQYAKRQETWFKKRPGVPPLNLEEPGIAQKIYEQIKKFLDR